MRGVKPDEITAVTFTNQAAAELRTRLMQQLGGKRAVRGLTVGTFHAICLHLLGDVRLLSQGEALTIAGDVLREAGAKGSARALVQAVSRVKNGASCAAADIEEALYQDYCARLQARGVLDFDDLLTEALKQDTAGRRQFRHLLVDEFQDIKRCAVRPGARVERTGQSVCDRRPGPVDLRLPRGKRPVL